MGVVSDARGQSAEDPAAAGPVPNWYCLEAAHSPDLVTEDRFFYYPDDPAEVAKLHESRAELPAFNSALPVGAPYDGRCRDNRTGLPRQVSAARVDRDLEGRPVIPAAVLSLGSRLG